MEILIYGSSIIMGFILGHFLKTVIILVISAISLVIAILLLKDEHAEGLAALPGFIISIWLGICNVAMWITWYFVEEKNFLSNIINEYILR